MTPNHHRIRMAAASAVILLFAIPSAVFSANRFSATVSSIAEVTASTLQQIEVRTRDYAFEMPATMKAGQVQITLVNEGKEAHHIWIVKLEGGKKLADVFEHLKGAQSFPSWAVNYGGPNAPVPGGKAVAIMDLDAGHYAVLCVIPSPDGKPHVMKGMAKEFDVVGSRTVASDLPKVDIEADLRDYDFVFSKQLQEGRNVIRFTNSAKQPHEAFIAKLMPGKKAADLVGWLMKPEGVPPGIPMGGITGIESGKSITIIQDLSPGTYALYCFVPDAKDGREHIAHGMMKEFTVAAR